MNSVLSRKYGCLYGLAIGDALGAAVEFQSPGSFEPVTGYRGEGPHGLEPGQWTDDTSMALALADSIAHGWNPKDQLIRYLDWMNNGKYSVNGRCFDIGNTTRISLIKFKANNNPIAKIYEKSDGNGSLMRLAPVAIRYYDHPDYIQFLRESSQTTHASLLCVDACIALGAMLNLLIEGIGKNCIGLGLGLGEYKLHPVIQKIVNNFNDNNFETVRGSGWVTESFEAALWAFRTTKTFEECVLKAVNLGDDADTTGAIAGQLAGTYYGYKEIPESLINGLDRKDLIETYLRPIL